MKITPFITASGAHLVGLGYVVNNHGEFSSPKDRVMGPLPNGLFMTYKWR